MFLAVAMTVTFVSSAMAADLSYWMGGDFYYYFSTQEGTRGLQGAPGIFTVDSILGAQITEGNTWAKMWYVNDTWNQDALYYALGVNKIGGVLDLGFSTKDTGIANIGQNPLGELFNDFKADPMFNTYDMGGAMSAVLNGEDFRVATEYVVVDGWNYERAAISGAVKLDGGDVHFGYKRIPGATDSLINLGGSMQVGEAKVTADVMLDDANIGTYGEIGALAGTKVQANVAMGQVDTTVFYNFAKNDGEKDMLGLGANFKATEKLTLGAKYFNNAPLEGSQVEKYEVYGLYDLGAFDIKVGMVDDSVDTYAILGFHASIW